VIAAILLFAAQAPDVDAPIIEDVAAASSNPQAAPIVTVLMSDRGSGVGTAAVLFRPLPAGSWRRAELKGGTGGLFIVRLPDGLQASGFDYYIEATDIAGNGPARVGSAEAPIRVEQATVPTLERLRRRRTLEPDPTIHPGWVMLSLSVGVLAGAGAAFFGLDLVQASADVAAGDAGRQDAVVSDAVMSSVLGVVAAAGLVTGGTLTVLSSME
jgi:hypothetical protein